MLKCMHEGCVNGATNGLQTVLHAVGSGPSNVPAKGFVKLFVCVEHATKEAALSFLTPEARQGLESVFAQRGLAPPCWERSFAQWVPLRNTA